VTEPYQDILAAAGFPTDVLVLDWETYFDKDYSLSKKDSSLVEYVADPRFEIIGLGWTPLPEYSDGPWFEHAGNVQATIDELTGLYGHNLQNVTVVMHNAFFDALILREKFDILPPFTVDTRDLARHLDARDRHGLSHLAKKYGAPKPKGDTKQFLGLHAADMTPEQWAAMSEYCRGDIDITAFLLKKLLPMITRPEYELQLAAQTLRMFLVPNLVVDMKLGAELEAGMQTEIQKAVDSVHQYDIWAQEPGKLTKRTNRPPVIRRPTADDINGDGMFISLLRQVLPNGEEPPMKPDKNGRMIPALAKTDTACTELLEHSSPAVRALVEARKATGSWPGHIKRVRRLLAQAECRGGKLGIPLNYYGGHTGRDSGSGGINPQNFGARDVHPLIKQVGSMLRAPEGYLLGTGDLSQIEARKIAWLAGQDDLLAQFAKGEDVYSDFAQNQIFHEETRKPREGDSPELVKALSIRRDFGKEVILAAGYGMGGPTFYARCYQNKSLKPLFDDGTYTPAFCDRLVRLYRGRYTKIVDYWWELEKAWRFVARYPDQRASVTHGPATVGFNNEGGTVVVTLPSGRCMFYPKANVNAQGNLSYTTGGTKYHLYGGKIAENVTQASARDVFTDGCLLLEEHGFPVVLRVHDAAVTLIPEADAEARLAEMHRLQIIVPDWCPGLPVAVEGRLVKCYEK